METEVLDYESCLYQILTYLDPILLPALAPCSKLLWSGCVPIMEQKLWLKCNAPRPANPVFHPHKLFVTRGDLCSIMLETCVKELTIWVERYFPPRIGCETRQRRRCCTCYPPCVPPQCFPPFIIHGLDSSETLERLCIHVDNWSTYDDRRLIPCWPKVYLPKSLRVLECTGANIMHLFDTPFPLSLELLYLSTWEAGWVILVDSYADPSRTKLYHDRRKSRINNFPSATPSGKQAELLLCHDCCDAYVLARVHYCEKCLPNHVPWNGYLDERYYESDENEEGFPLADYPCDYSMQDGYKRKLRTYVEKRIAKGDPRYSWCTLCDWAHTPPHTNDTRDKERYCRCGYGRAATYENQHCAYYCARCSLARPLGMDVDEEAESYLEIIDSDGDQSNHEEYDNDDSSDSDEDEYIVPRWKQDPR